MTLGLYKPGQGYWVRVMTASLLGVFVAAFAGWMWGQGALLADSLPRTHWTYTLASGAPDATGIDRVYIYRDAETADQYERLGVARVADYDAVSRLVRIADFELLVQDGDPGQASQLRSEAATFTARVIGRAGEPPVQPLYIQGGLAALVLILGAGIGYWLIGARPGTVDFLVATDMEMKKVNWSTRKDIIGSTWVVIGMAFILATILFGFDTVLMSFFRWIGVLIT